MSRIDEPFEGSDFEDACEDCGAPAGHLCFDDCPSGYSSITQEEHAALLRQHKKLKGNRPSNLEQIESNMRRNKRPCDEFPACGANCTCH